jgi:arylsulfatase A-like enzyme
MAAELPRDVLPIADRPVAHSTALDAKDPGVSFPPITPLRPPAGAPNVLIVLLDDVGFGAAATFGGPIATPTADRLASSGLRYSRFHTTSLCAPTRSALLTGRNHHAVGMGAVPEVATSAPGYTSIRPKAAAPIAEVLRLNGYSTAQFGKCHEVPVWETSPIGPFDAWPTGGGGFEHFYGFIGGESNQYYPALYNGTTPVEPEKTPEEGYHLTEDLTDHAIAWIRQAHTLAPDKPFFAYFAPGATHAPHHVPAEWSDRYKGRFDDGWDALRERMFARQKELGVVPPEAELTARPAEIPAWDAMPDALKPVLSRQMEVYAGFLEHVDHHAGRLVDAIEDLGILDDTLVFYIVGDNGASGEGTLNGSFNEMFLFNGAAALETPEFLASHIEDFGTPAAYNHFAVGWAHAMDTPYQWTKQVASHWGGTRNGMVVHWPARIAARGEVRTQFHHVIDLAPTILEAAGLPAPTKVNGIPQMPLHGTSMAYTYDDAAAPDRRTTQYFECFVNRGIYHEGWTAVTRHSTPWVVGPLPPIADDRWELYGPDDWTQAHDLAAEMPDKLAELKALFLEEAVKYDVLPLDDRRVERFNADIAGRPQLIHGTTQVLYGGMQRLSEASVLSIKNRSHSITADITVPEGGASGVVVAQGSAFGGWSLYLAEGRPAYCYNLFGLRRFKIRGADPVPAGEHQVRAEFAYDGGGLAKGGTVTLYVDGSLVGEGRVDGTEAMIFSGDETTDVGADTGTPVSDDYPAGENGFTGTVHRVAISIGADAEDPDHQVSPDEWFRMVMARQ